MNIMIFNMQLRGLLLLKNLPLGSDAIHPDPDYSAVYVTLVTDIDSYKGFGIGFTLGIILEIYSCQKSYSKLCFQEEEMK